MLHALSVWFHTNFDIVEDPHTREIRSYYSSTLTRRERRALKRLDDSLTAMYGGSLLDIANPAVRKRKG